MAVPKEMIPVIVKTGASARVAHEVAASFKAGDKVRTKNINPTTHTRLPRYVRGKVGTIRMDHGIFVMPDAAAHGLGEHPQHLYSIVFTSAELWGSSATSNDSVTIDLWDDYLEKVGA